jgi:EAL domain-containing protein (putative c-di-GMP-specific phosphodiesterase class I)
VVAEGVETAAQHLEVTRLGCDSCQGFYFERPMGAAGLEALMEDHMLGDQARLPAGVGSAFG